MYEELWLGPSSGMAWNMSGWRRPFRLHHFAKHDAFLMSNPVTIGAVRGKNPIPCCVSFINDLF